MAEEEKKLVQNVVAAISSHDIEKIESFFTDDCVYEDIAFGEVMVGKEAVKAGYSALFSAVPDFKLEIVSLISASMWIASEWIMTGTSTTGKSFSTQGVTISEMQGGKVSRNRDYYNPSSLREAIQ